MLPAADKVLVNWIVVLELFPMAALRALLVPVCAWTFETAQAEPLEVNGHSAPDSKSIAAHPEPLAANDSTAVVDPDPFNETLWFDVFTLKTALLDESWTWNAFAPLAPCIFTPVAVFILRLPMLLMLASE
jgi:hypothetical protein